MCEMDIEDRIFELYGERLTSGVILDRVVAEYGISHAEAVATARKVVRERGTPGLAALRRHIERLGQISVVADGR